jgi:ABC-2 type transport system permease protein
MADSPKADAGRGTLAGDGGASALPPASAPPSVPLWFLRVQAGFLRWELVELSKYRAHMLTRAVSFGFAVVSVYFFARFVGDSGNRHLERYGGDYLAFGLIGLVLSDLQHVGVSALAQRVRDAQLMGYLEAELATPAPEWMVLSAWPVYEFGAALVRSTIYLTGAALFLGLDLGRARLGSALLALPLVLLAFLGLGLLSAAATMLTRRSNPLALVLGAASVFLAGVAYPVTVLPGWLQRVAALLPLTHALEATRLALLTGASAAELAPSLQGLAICGAVTAPVGLALFVYALRRARRDGSLSHY